MKTKNIIKEAKKLDKNTIDRIKKEYYMEQDGSIWTYDIYKQTDKPQYRAIIETTKSGYGAHNIFNPDTGELKGRIKPLDPRRYSEKHMINMINK